MEETLYYLRESRKHNRLLESARLDESKTELILDRKDKSLVKELVGDYYHNNWDAISVDKVFRVGDEGIEVFFTQDGVKKNHFFPKAEVDHRYVGGDLFADDYNDKNPDKGYFKPTPDDAEKMIAIMRTKRGMKNKDIVVNSIRIGTPGFSLSLRATVDGKPYEKAYGKPDADSYKLPWPY